MLYEKKNRRSLDSFIISAILHIIFVLILASYITVTSHAPESAIDVAWIEMEDQNIIIPRPLVDESYLRRTVPKVVSDITTSASEGIRSATIAEVIAPARNSVMKSIELNTKGIQDMGVIPEVSTIAKITPGSGIPMSAPVNTGDGIQVGRGLVTGKTRAGGGGGGKGGLSILSQGSAPQVNLLPENIQSPTKLTDDKLGGMLIGKGNNISGHIRLVRVKHGLSDWWQDPSALTGLVDWLNKNTRIHADMKVAGGVLTLDDPRLFESPLLIMTGHDRSVTIENNLTQPERRGGKLDTALSDAEKVGLRKYLIEKGGMLFFDDCGFKGLFADEVKAILKEILPEYSLENIARTDEIFSCYYNLSGAPRGSEMFWGSENEGKGAVFPYLQGIRIGTRLAVIVSRKDYLCAIETVEIPSHTQLRYRYSPEVYKFMSNLVVYAMKYGGIADRSDYN
ncbi:TPA: DUF4159 domain-containing protein [bacterium]|nr:DUF4159 domain-containing protein [bacterium]